MHKARSLLVAVVMVISAAALLSISASAAGPFTDVVFHIRPSFSGLNCPPFTCGTWDETVAGEIVDSGSYVREFAQTAPPDRPFGETGPYREVFLLTSVSGTGTLTINAEERALPDGDNTGVWQVHSGSGTYADASGHGTSNFNGPTLTLTLTGVIAKVAS